MCKLHGVRLVKGIKIFESISTKIYRCFTNHVNENFLEKSYYYYYRKNNTGKFLPSIFIFLIFLFLVHAIRNFEQNLGSRFCTF